MPLCDTGHTGPVLSNWHLDVTPHQLPARGFQRSWRGGGQCGTGVLWHMSQHRYTLPQLPFHMLGKVLPPCFNLMFSWLREVERVSLIRLLSSTFLLCSRSSHKFCPTLNFLGFSSDTKSLQNMLRLVKMRVMDSLGNLRSKWLFQRCIICG